MHATAAISMWSSKRSKQPISTKWQMDVSLKTNYIFTGFVNKGEGQTESNTPTAEKPSDRSSKWDKSIEVRTAIIPKNHQCNSHSLFLF